MPPEPRVAATAPPRTIPYSRQSIDEDDIAAVVEVLRGEWLTTGPRVGEFERAFASAVGAVEAVAVSSGTAALHAMMHALEIGPGDEVIVPTLTFAATANAVLYVGATPVFADVRPDTLLVDPRSVESRIGPRTRAVVAVDYAGQPCDYAELQTTADRYGLALLADACHSLGATWQGRAAGTLARLSAFSFHPVKPITTGEGGMVATDEPELAERMRVFRNHGITVDHRRREASGTWFYEMQDLGFNYRLNDLQCALGLSQLKRLPAMVARRRTLAEYYDRRFAEVDGLRPTTVDARAEHARHLYVVQTSDEATRATAYTALRARGVGVNVHYVPVHLHPYYRRRFGTGPGSCPVAERAYERILSLPLHPQMSDADAEFVADAVSDVVRGAARRAA